MKLIVAFSCLIPVEVSAQSYCSAPSEPYCLRSFNTFTDEYAFDSCRRDMEAYADEVNNYSNCLQASIEEVAEEAGRLNSNAVSEYEEAIDYWNCKASDPERYC